MPRTKKASAGENMMEAVARLPWCTGALLAFVLYVALHRLAAPGAPSTLQPGHMGEFVQQALIRSFANVGQYILPLICLVGAALSAWKRHERKGLVDNVVRSKAADSLDQMTWQEFERLVGESFRLQGYSVMESGGGGADGGVDLVVRKEGEKFLVQCKQWKAFKVGVDVVRQLYGVMAATGAAGGFVVTSGSFTKDAASFADGRNITLINGERLHAMLQAARRTNGPPPSNLATPVAREQTSPSIPLCPLCAKLMVKRVSKRGANAGSAFWGCSGFPACKGTRT